ncbi:MAG: undecaprenyldiphospho-muramoylpentapeptide beta-N-acetylglucosaminyltransferase [Clostridia bacterium]|nr:undecaprenyldiphospho-muramoylpentapeptide beta-N-acetylglucosaminyltransferase [Clostridia bacterium]
MKVIIAAAGTGGHINPGIAIANKIKEEEPDSRIIFIGTKRGIENDLVNRAGYMLKTVDSYGFSRKLTVENMKNALKTIGSIGQAKKIIKKFNPDLIIGTGGYICISVCTAAKSLNIPYIIHESNVLPGKATKFLSKDAEKILLGFKEAEDRLPSGVNVAVTGTPIKGKNLNYDKSTIELKKDEYGLDSKKPLVLVFGGSQGSKSINKAMKEIVINRFKHEEKLKDDSIKFQVRSNPNFNKYQVIWASGPSQYDSIKTDLIEENLNIDNLKGVKIMPYIYNMDEIMNVADLIVCRSGAMTVTELEEMGKPSILIPYPFAAENHQEYNARALEDEGAAKVILDKDLNSKLLNDTINNLISNEKNLRKMGNKSRELSISNVEDKIYTEIKETLESI